MGQSDYGCCKVVPDAGTAHCERAERLKQSPYAILGFASPPLAARKDGIELLYPRSRICQATLLQPCQSDGQINPTLWSGARTV
jgi:hypothetical protein